MGNSPTSTVPHAPTISKTSTKGPATADVRGEKTLNSPNMTKQAGAVPASAPKPMPKADAMDGGIQRSSKKVYIGIKTAIPATAR